MRVLVTGASGMLGRDLVDHLSPRHGVTAVDLDVDVTDPGAVWACVEECRPEAIFHLAAWTDVDGAEHQPAAAAAVNCDGSANVAAAAARVGAAMVLPSTDYVFDGTLGRAYREDDLPAPLGVYGRTKLEGEQRAAAAYPEGVRVARTAWLYGVHGRNFVDTMRALGAERDEVTVVADQVGCPTWTRDLCPALEALVERPAGIYHTAGGGAVSWAGFAEAIFDLEGIDCRVVPVTTAQFGRPAPRPAHSPLDVSRPGAPRLRHWRDALADYLAASPTTEAA